MSFKVHATRIPSAVRAYMPIGTTSMAVIVDAAAPIPLMEHPDDACPLQGLLHHGPLPPPRSGMAFAMDTIRILSNLIARRTRLACCETCLVEVLGQHHLENGVCMPPSLRVSSSLSAGRR